MNIQMICQICKKPVKNLKSLGLHLVKSHHDISIKQYYDIYLKKENDGICYCGNKTRFISLKGYSKNCCHACATTSNISKSKYKKTMLEKYGAEYPIQSKKIQKKYKQTCLRKYGYEYPTKNLKIKEKITHTMLKVYGSQYPYQCDEIKEKGKATLLRKYNQDNYSKTDHGRLTSRITAIKAREDGNGGKFKAFIGKQEPEFFKELQSHCRFKIIKQDDTFRYIIGRFPDGHIPELKIFIQFDERYHFMNKECTVYRKEDIRCTKDLESVPGYRVFRVSEKEWKENKNQIINRFKKLIFTK